MQENDLTLKPVATLLRQLSVPISIGYIFYTLFNVVDTFFAGMISTEALAALSISFPVFFLVISVSAGITTGSTAVISHALGAGDKQAAMRFAAQSISYAILASLMLTVVGLLLSESMFRLLGADDSMLEIALAYMDIIFIGAASFVIAGVLNSILTAQGQTKPYRNFLILSFFLNLIFDPWFLFGGFGVPALGIKGIALATILIESIGVVYLFKHALSTGLLCRECLSMLVPQRTAYWALSAQSVPACFNMLTIAIGIFVRMYFVADFGEEAIAAYGIGVRTEQLVLLPTLGLNMATLAIVGQNKGAGLFDRVLKTWKTAIYYSLIVTQCGAFLLLVFAKQFILIFSNDPAVLNFGSGYLFIAALSLSAYGLMFVSINALQGFHRPVFPLIVGVVRQAILPLVLIPLSLLWFSGSIFGVWWALFGIIWVSTLVTVWFTWNVLRVDN